jgi:hypothetical protein
MLISSSDITHIVSIHPHHSKYRDRDQIELTDDNIIVFIKSMGNKIKFSELRNIIMKEQNIPKHQADKLYKIRTKDIIDSLNNSLHDKIKLLISQ